jgi:hypothetical protein
MSVVQLRMCLSNFIAGRLGGTKGYQAFLRQEASEVRRESKGGSSGAKARVLIGAGGTD